MDGHERGGSILQRKGSAAQRADRRRAAEQAADRSRAQRDDHSGLDDRALKVLPPAAAIDLVGIRPLVQAALTTQLVLEVLHRIGDECLLSRNAGVIERLVEHSPGRTDERQAGQILFVAGLLADQHDRRPPRALPGHRLGGVAVERTAPAIVSAARSAESEVTTGPSLSALCRVACTTIAFRPPLRRQGTKA